MNKAKVLFLCTGNSARSQMAQAFLREYGGDQFEAYSAGTEPKGIHPYTYRVMEDAGISLSGQQSKHVKEYMGKIHFGYLITLCNEAEESCPTTFPELDKDYTGHLKILQPLWGRRMKSWPSFGRLGIR